MKKALLFLFSLLIGSGILWWIINTVGLEAVKVALLTFSGPEGIVILSLTILGLIIGLWKWKEILKSQGYDISPSNLWRPYFAGFSIMFFIPMVIFGGEVFRAYVLRERHNIAWSKGMASVIIDKILEFTSYVVIIFIGFIIFLLKIGLPPKNLAIIFGSALILFIPAVVFFYFRSFKKESILKIFIKKTKNNQGLELEGEVFKFFKPKNKFMWRGFWLTFLKVAVTFTRAWILILFLGKTLGFFSVLSILGFYYLALMIPIPAALGTHDAAQVFAFSSFGIGAGSGAAFAMIIRGAELLVAFGGIVILFKLGTELLKSFLLKGLGRIQISE